MPFERMPDLDPDLKKILSLFRILACDTDKWVRKHEVANQ
jgi:hypothetical protein